MAELAPKNASLTFKQSSFFCAAVILSPKGYSFKLRAKRILEEREIKATIENEIIEIDNQILTNEKDLQLIEEEIASIVNQMQDLDITVRQCNELKKKKEELENEIKTLNTSNESLLQKKKNLKTKF